MGAEQAKVTEVLHYSFKKTDTCHISMCAQAYIDLEMCENRLSCSCCLLQGSMIGEGRGPVTIFVMYLCII